MIDIHNVKAIDSHSHYNHGHRNDTVVDELYYADIENLKKMYDGANIDKVFFSTYGSVLKADDVVAENEYNCEMSQKYDWLYQWVVIDPRNDETFIQAKNMLAKNKCVGIKLHPPCHEYSIVEYGDKVFSFAAECQAVVQIHSMTDSIDQLPPFANKYKDMKLIIAHLGSLNHIEAIKNAKYQNIYTDTSGMRSYANNVIEYAVKQVGADKILFGTDTYSAGFQRGRIEYALISDEDKYSILRGNAERLFKK